MAADVTFLQHLERKPSTVVLVGHPAFLIPAASYSLRLGPAIVAQMSCRLDAAGYWKTSGTTASQTSNFVTFQDTWWSFLKINMDLGDLRCATINWVHVEPIMFVPYFSFLTCLHCSWFQSSV